LGEGWFIASAGWGLGSWGEEEVLAKALREELGGLQGKQGKTGGLKSAFTSFGDFLFPLDLLG